MYCPSQEHLRLLNSRAKTAGARAWGIRYDGAGRKNSRIIIKDTRIVIIAPCLFLLFVAEVVALERDG